MAATRLTEVERKYFARKIGAGITARTPLNQLKRQYMASVIGGTIRPDVRIDVLETLWLQKIAGTAGYTPAPDGKGLWVQAVASISKTPTKSTTDNKIIFYLNAP